MSLDYLHQFPMEINVSPNFKSLQFTLIMGLMFKFILVIFFDKERVHNLFLGFFQSAILSHVLMNPKDSESKLKGDNNSSVKKQKRVDPILQGGDVEDIVLGSLRLMSNPDEAATLDVESHEIFGLFEKKDPSPDEVKDAFDVFDCDGDGFIDSKDLQKVLCSLGLDKGLEMDSFKRMIDVFDENGDGRLDFEEFVQFLEFSLWS